MIGDWQYDGANRMKNEHGKCQQRPGHRLLIDGPFPVYSPIVCEPASVPVLMTHRPQLGVRLGRPITNH
jgi:hypothetical protein